MDLKRKPLTVKWTEYYRREHKKATVETIPEPAEAETKVVKGNKK